ncbi:AMP-binding protein [Agrobacterium vitis]|uniref:AMP-binding protein n=1 Tax=Agrobacterium vitis TaxID=373 RepID=A0A6L6VE95_AGRVI|nr:AMP-binding protein [Agrobacterium vitis]
MATGEKVLVSTVIDAFEKAVAANPQRCAVRYQDATLTYAQLDARSSLAATRLLQAGARPCDTIGIQMPRGIDLIVMLLATLKARCGFCFINPKNPQSWNNSVIERAKVRLFIADGPLCNVTFAGHLQATDLLAPGEVDYFHKPAAGDIVYVNFSSGTTGAPKIIPCTHLGVIGFCYQPPHFPAGPETVMIHHSALTFDASQFEIWTAICNGGCLVLAPEEHLTGDTLRQLIAESGANALWLTTSLLNMLMDADPECLGGISNIMVGGEALSPLHIERLYRDNPRITVYNGYGPTENTMGTCVYRIPRSHDFSRPIPIGYPVHDSRLYVANQEGRPCSAGEVGELVIAGDGLSPGYIGDAPLTANKFRAFPLLGEERAYASGDLVSCDEDGLFHYAGRKDDQVKIRGNRTSLSDIALAYGRHPGVANCVAAVQTTPTGKRIMLYYLAKSMASSPGEVELREFGITSLPDFMVPDRFVQVEVLPVTAHGKIDMVALEAMNEAKNRPVASRHWLLDACGLSDWQPDRDFFQAGGHSVLAVKLLTLLNRHREVPLSLTEFYRDCSWPRMAHLLDEMSGNPADDPEPDIYDYHIIRL